MATKEQELSHGCFADAAPNEPLFVLRSTDSKAPGLVREWARLYYAEKVADRQPPRNASAEELQLFEAEQARRVNKHAEALALADQMEAYRAAQGLA